MDQVVTLQRRRHWLFTVATWLTLVLILQTTISIVSRYPDYFPPDFSSLFLEGRQDHFHGLYELAFYLHIVVGPSILFSGAVLLWGRLLPFRQPYHAWLGRVHVLAIVMVLTPSSLVMAQHAFGGWPAWLSFSLLSLLTATCAIAGVRAARRREFVVHRRWMLRCFVLLSSAVVLRILSGMASVVGVENPELAYQIAAWTSWLGPLAILELTSKRSVVSRSHP
ncbi:MAG: DUF2306 domain-containing protein [Fimbriiglobus sp.]